MQIPASQADFYERKINRLEKDIANLNQELTVARGRLRSAEDFQIKYQLLLRQSQQQSIRIKKMEETERTHFAQIMAAQIEQINAEWSQKLIQIEQNIRNEQKLEKQSLKAKIQQLQKKRKEFGQVSEQRDMYEFKNKKIAKELEALQQIIEQDRKKNERQREEDLKFCRETLTKKFNDKIALEKQLHEQALRKQEQRYEKLEIQLMKRQIVSNQSIPPVPVSLGVETNIQNELDKLNELLKQKDKTLQRIQAEKIEDQERHQKQIKYLKSYSKELEDQIYSLHSSHEIEILNLRTRLQETRIQELKQKEKECEIVEKQHLKDIEVFNEKILKEKAELQQIRKIQEAEIHKLKEDKERLLKKISELKARLKEFEANQQNGETILMVKSLKNVDNKQDELNSYEDGVTFLERQLKKTTIKLQKKNSEIKELVAKMNHMNQQFERELSETKQKQSFTIGELKYKIESLEEQNKQLNEQIRRKDKQIRDQDAEYMTKINKVSAENRSLINMNNDLNRDYNRILESKKVIEKSFREQKERSITSKSEIAITKKNKWLELERQKNQIEIIYKQRQEQLKTHYQILLREERTQLDKFKSEKELLAHQLNSLKQKLKSIQPKGEEKENLLSEYHKKLATANLQIALTQNLYNSLMKTKSRVKKPGETNQKQPQGPEPKPKKQVPILPIKRSQFQNHLNRIEEKGYGSFERSIKEIEKISENQSRHEQTSRDFIQIPNDQQPLAFEDSDQGGMSPTFNMLHSFNPRST